MAANKNSKNQEQRFTEAEANLKELEKILAPFIRPRKIVNTTTQGKWHRVSKEDTILTNEVFQESIKKLGTRFKASSPKKNEE